MVTKLWKAIRPTLLGQSIRKLRARQRAAQWTGDDQRMLDLYSRFVSPGALCFDVGANDGNRLKVFLRLQTKVVAVEPQPDCVRLLRAAYGDASQLTIVPSALGSAPGQAEMMISDTDEVSSMSPEWIAKVTQSGRFAERTWEKKQIVPVTTLDELIKQHGVPQFVKIDVEGFEEQVVRGLSRPVPCLSLEFTPECLDSSLRCIEHLNGLGDIRMNYSSGESMQLELEEWLPVSEGKAYLSKLAKNGANFGDYYVRFEGLESGAKH